MDHQYDTSDVGPGKYEQPSRFSDQRSSVHSQAPSFHFSKATDPGKLLLSKEQAEVVIPYIILL